MGREARRTAHRARGSGLGPGLGLRTPRASGGCPGRPRGQRGGAGCETGRMPVLDPNPQNGQKKMLVVFGSFLAIFIVIGIIAAIASP
ncbi:hypothetical protein GCM10027075_67030 [Streptomyces heilongjiangensis]